MELSSLQVTAELFTIPLDDALLVYAPLQQVAFVANRAAINRIADLQQQCVDLDDEQTQDLVEFLRRLGIVDGPVEAAPVNSCSGIPKQTMVTLFLTTMCNLRCTYCYAAAGDTPRQLMRLEVAQRGIDSIIAQALELDRDEIAIGYHGGGEPSLNWRTLTESYLYANRRAKEVGLQVRAAMATNGVLPEEKIAWIIEHLDSVNLSFDGLPEVHDAHRLTVLGAASSPQVEHTIRRFDEAGFDYGLRLTVTYDQIDRMRESVCYVCSNFRPQRIQIEPAYQLGRWKDSPSAETQAFIDGFRSAQNVARHYGQTIEFSGARAGTLSNHFCGATQDSFGLTADGSVSACYEVFTESTPWAEKFIYGEYDEDQQGFRFDLTVLNKLRQRTVDRCDVCHGCFAKWSCGGDCYYKTLAFNNDGEFLGTDRCHIIRELTKDQLLENIELSGGFVWHPFPEENLQNIAYRATTHAKEST